MNNTYPSTNEIILDRVIQGTDCQRCVDWAVGQLVEGVEKDYVCRLAGQRPPFDQIIISDLRDRALTELGFSLVSDEALICHLIASELQVYLGNDSDTGNVLTTAASIYLSHKILDLQPLYMLYHARKELEEFGEQYYINDYTKSNRLIRTAQITREFISEHIIR
ncbi:MAG: hypothetical protein ACKVH8_20310 [Pirellulales bacterium]|jgi:hypothetical protein